MTKILFFILNKLFFQQSRFVIFESNDDFSEGTFEFYKYCARVMPINDLVWFIKKSNRKKALSIGVKKYVFIDGSSLFQKIKKVFYAKQCRWYCYSHRFLLNRKVLNKRAICLYFSHGTPFKYAPAYTREISKDAFVLANNDFVKNIYIKKFSINDKRLLTCINPRVSPLLKQNFKGSRIKNLLSIPDSSKLIVVLLTWNKSKSSCAGYLDCLPFDFSIEDLIRLDDIYRKRGLFLLIKLHPMMVLEKNDNLEKKTSFSNIFILDNNSFETKGFTLYDLLSCSDALITDYSSVFIDYYNLNRMIYFCEPSIDFELMKEKNQSLNNGFVFENPKQYMVGEFISSFDDLFSLDPCKDLKTMVERIGSANKLWNFPCDYNPCERIMNFLIQTEGEV